MSVLFTTFFDSILNTFYSDFHIIIINFLIKKPYSSEYMLEKELDIPVEKIKLITGSLYTENFIKYEDRFFKHMHIEKQHKKTKNFFYKIRYWFVEPKLIFSIVKQKIKKMLVLYKKTMFNQHIQFHMKCSRKICEKIYSLEELTVLKFDESNKKFRCNAFLNHNIICGGTINQHIHTNFEQMKLEKNDLHYCINLIERLLVFL